jgi:NTP pyrophosphatase (non-canonical NTP hydrolase)
MTITHAELVQKLTKPGEQIAAEITPKDLDLWHCATGVAGEAGELLDAIKKMAIYRKPLDLTNVIEEIGDVEYFLERIRATLGITREQTIEHNIAKLTKRYGDTYSNQAAQVRSDKQ